MAMHPLRFEIARSLGSAPLLNGLRLSVLTYLARKAGDMPGSVVVLDEFPYLAPPRPGVCACGPRTLLA